MAHILVICTANICRSPVAKGVLQDRLQKRGLTDWTVDSAGTWANAVRGASNNSIVVMEGYGLDISDHQSKMVSAEDLEKADLVLCMEMGHAEALKAEFNESANKIFTLTEMVGQKYSINDPYGGSLIDYQHMASEIVGIIDNGLSRIIQLAEQNSQEG